MSRTQALEDKYSQVMHRAARQPYGLYDGWNVGPLRGNRLGRHIQASVAHSHLLVRLSFIELVFRSQPNMDLFALREK